MGFKVPKWAVDGAPGKAASLQAEGCAPVPVDAQGTYTLGRDADGCDVVLAHEGASRLHAALVHHTDGRVYVIDLGSTRGTRLDGRTVEKNKPVQLYDGSELQFGGGPAYRLVCPAAGQRAGSAGGAEVRCSHLLVKHAGSRKASSWKEPVITRTQDEALAMIQAFRERLVSGQVEFAALARKESHCSSGPRSGGDLGFFGPGKMQAAFDSATRALEVGELSGPVVSDSGVHLILRTG